MDVHAARLPVAPASDSSPSIDQARLFQLWQAYPAARSALHIGSVARVSPGLDVARLQRSLEQVVARHSSLRTSFEEGVEGSLRRRIHPPAEVTRALGPLVAEPTRSEEIAARFRALLDEPLDMRRAPLWRARLFCTGAEQYALALVCHHIVSDHRSLAEFFFELSRAYDRDAAGGAGGDAGFDSDADFDEQAMQHYLRRERGAVQPDRMGFWRELIAGTRPVVGLGRPERRTLPAVYEVGTISFTLPTSLSRALGERLRGRELRPAAFFLAAFQLLIQRRTGGGPFLVGVALDGRGGGAGRDAMGFLSGPAVVRADARASGLWELAERAQRQLMAVVRRRPFPYARLAPAIAAEQGVGSSLQYLFSFIGPWPDETGGLNPTPLHSGVGRTNFDLWLTMQPRDDRMVGQIDYAAALFSDREAQALADELVALVGEHVEPVAVSAPAVAASAGAKPAWSLALASTFTVDPLVAPLEAWGRFFERPLEIKVVATGLVETALLQNSPSSGGERTATVVLMRASDFAGERAGRLDDVVRALASSMARTTEPHLVCVAPSRAEPETEAQLLARLGQLKGLHVLPSGLIAQRYPVEQGFDEVAERLGQIPFTAEMYLALATGIFRRLLGLQRRPLKAIVVDGDNTLWGGVLGEDGVDGVSIDDDRRALHRHLLERREAGVLLCLCSKNDPELVRSFFERRTDSLLTADDFVAQRVTWEPKSESVRSLAAELGFGLDSLLLLDDSPAEIAELMARAPEVLCVRTPAHARELPAFLEHLWPTDVGPSTAEDRQRHGFHQAERQRQQLAAQGGEYLAYLAQLAVEVEVRALTGGELERAAQLTARVTQFNVNGERLTVAQLERGLRQPERQGWLVSVRTASATTGPSV
jgi:FkbH-like protein